MSQTPPSDTGPYWGHPPPAAFRQPPRWPMFVTLTIALIGIAVGFVGWFRPVPHNNQPPPKPTYTAQQTADAKAKVCVAFEKLERAVGVANAVPHGSDANGTLAAATTMRQVFDVASRYLFATLAELPATPADLAAAVRNAANSLQEGVMGYLDGLTNSDPEMQPLVNANTEAAETIRGLCK